MSHLAMRLGDLLHFHPFAHRPATRESTLVEDISAPVVARPHVNLAGDLAFFSLSIEHRVRDPRADLDRMGLIGLGDTYDAPPID